MTTEKILHIGFPKTGTTFLRRHLFSSFCKDNNYLFNPHEFKKIRNQRFNFTDKDKEALKEIISQNNVLISQAGLLDWNPSTWEFIADKALELFGEDTKIVITIRDPADLMCSLYMQHLQEGNIFRAQDFFVSTNEYERLKVFIPELSSLRYDYQKLDYSYLKLIYEERFNNVYFMPLSRINSLYPFNKLLSLSENEFKKYTKIFKNAPSENQSYSKLAVKLTLIRERVIRSFGLKSLGSNDYPYDNDFLTPFNPYNSSSFLKIIRPWRWWMHRIIDRFYPYKKFTLPDEVLERFESDLMKQNRQFILELEKRIDNKLQLLK